jgi:hypothetical protein
VAYPHSVPRHASVAYRNDVGWRSPRRQVARDPDGIAPGGAIALGG